MQAKKMGLLMERAVASLIGPMMMKQKMADMVVYGYNPITWEINYTNEVTPE
jgi:hypothetical protein